MFDLWILGKLYIVSQKKLGHFYFYCNFVECWPILIILSLSEPEIISAVI